MASALERLRPGVYRCGEWTVRYWPEDEDDPATINVWRGKKTVAIHLPVERVADLDGEPAIVLNVPEKIEDDATRSLWGELFEGLCGDLGRILATLVDEDAPTSGR
jgi:hypothetical protein